MTFFSHFSLDSLSKMGICILQAFLWSCKKATSSFLANRFLEVYQKFVAQRFEQQDQIKRSQTSMKSFSVVSFGVIIAFDTFLNFFLDLKIFRSYFK